MKTLFKPLFAVILATIAFTSCMDDNSGDYEADLLAQQKAIDSALHVEINKIDDYVLSTGEEWEKDTVNIPLSLLNKTINRGIRYQIIDTPTEEDEKAYEYKMGGNQLPSLPNSVKLKYAVYALDEDKALEEDKEGSEYNFTSSNSHLTDAWLISFFPAQLQSNGNTISFGQYTGLTKNGLKKGSKIRVITPSLWFGNPFSGTVTADYLPSKEPVIYEFEVLGIN